MCLSIFFIIFVINYYGCGTDRNSATQVAKTTCDCESPLAPASPRNNNFDQDSIEEDFQCAFDAPFKRFSVFEADQHGLTGELRELCMELPMWAPLWKETFPLPGLSIALVVWHPSFQSAQVTEGTEPEGELGLGLAIRKPDKRTWSPSEAES